MVYPLNLLCMYTILTAFVKLNKGSLSKSCTFTELSIRAITRNTCYYMASSVSGQDELNPVL